MAELRSVLLIVPRFHSNLIGLDHALAKHEVSLQIVADGKGPSESEPLGNSIVWPKVNRSVDSVRQLLIRLKPDLLLHRAMSIHQDTFWNEARNLGIPCVAFDQGPAIIGLDSFLSQPVVTSRFVLSHRLRRLRIRDYQRITVVKKWGLGPGWSVSSTFFAPLPLDSELQVTPPRSTTARALEVLSVAKHGQRRKRVRWLIRAQAESSIRFNLTLIGSSPRSASTRRQYARDIRQAKKNLKAGQTVRFLTDIPRNAVIEQMKSSDLFVLPAHSEPFAVSVLEAIGVGLPVLVAHTGGAASYVEDRKNGAKFWVWSYQSFSRRLTNLLGSPTMLRDMGIQAAAYRSAEVTGDSFVSQLRRAINQIEN